MAGNFDLNPVGGGSDPQARLLQRVASMEQRLAYQEARRDIRIEMFEVDDPGVSSVDFDYTWAGGRAWALWGGSIFTGTLGVTTFQLWTNGVFRSDRSQAQVFSGGRYALNEGAYNLAAAPALAIGANTITLTRAGSGANWWAHLLVIEWPQE